jgi:hypothetical protein
VTFVEGTITFADGAITFVGRAMTFIGGAMTFMGGAVTFMGGAVTFVGRAMTFIGKESLAVGERLFKTARAGAGVAGDIKGVNGCNLRRRLIIYELKSPSFLINSLIFASNYSI